MKKKKAKKDGLTLVELMAAVATGSFVILASGIILSFGQESWNEECKRAGLQREAAYAMLGMTQQFKAATNAMIDDANFSAILVYNSDGDSIRFGKVAGQTILRKNINGGNNIDITDKLQNLQFYITPSGKLITTKLTLQVDNVQASSVSSVMLRNFGG